MVYRTIKKFMSISKIFFSRLYHANKIMFSNILASIVDAMHINEQIKIPLRFSSKIDILRKCFNGYCCCKYT